ncbi:MAG: hypothetical protein WD334_09880 [Chitinophagales bacterium]
MFNRVIGQDQIKEKLRQQLLNEQISHAQLFLGPLGNGGLALALDFAAYILSDEHSDLEAAEKTNAYQKAKRLVHPDLNIVYPYPKLKKDTRSEHFSKDFRNAVTENPYLSHYEWLQQIGSENKQLNIPIQDCHGVIKKLSLKSFESKYKVMIIWMADFLGKEGNVLLKILEEPPENTVFLLVAEDQDKLLNTVLSRTQIIKVNNIAQNVIHENLCNNYELSDSEAQKISSLCNGNWNQALNLINQGVNESADFFKNWMRFLIMAFSRNDKMSYPGLLKWVDEFNKVGRESQKNFCNYALYILREVWRSRITGNQSGILSADEQKMAVTLEKMLDSEQIELLNQLFNDVHYHIERNAHTKILMFNQSIKAGKIIAGKYKSSGTFNNTKEEGVR